MHTRGRSLHPALAALVLAGLAAAVGAADRTVLAIGAHAGDAEITSGVALDVDPFAKKRVLDSLP
jgi:hypothetical protein